MPATIAVLAKAPRPGRVKTRLCPPCSPGQAASLARAALLDTIDAVAAVPVRRVLVLDGSAASWRIDGFAVIAQRGEGLAERLAHAFADLGGPTLLVGMDTPQVTPQLLGEALRALDGAASVIGGARDGGYWAIGLHEPDPRVFASVPMSVAGTGAAQRRALRAAGVPPRELPVLRDVDTFADALAVARAAPVTRFARRVATLSPPRAAHAAPTPRPAVV